MTTGGPANNVSSAKATALVLFVMVGLLLFAIARNPSRLSDHRATQPISYRINPNTADRDTLCLLPGIGPQTAQKIIDNRAAQGPFKNTDDLERVKGIGAKTAAAMKPWILFDSEN